MLQDIAAQQSQVALDQVTYNRYAALLKLNSIARRSTTRRVSRLLTAQSTLGSLKDRRRCSSPSWAAISTMPVEQLPQYHAGKAQVDEAQRQLDHAIVRAPFDGMVTRSGFAAARHAGDFGAVGLHHHQRGRPARQAMSGSKPT